MLNMNILWLTSEGLEGKVMVEYLTTVRLEIVIESKLLNFPQSEEN